MSPHSLAFRIAFISGMAVMALAACTYLSKGGPVALTSIPATPKVSFETTRPTNKLVPTSPKHKVNMPGIYKAVPNNSPAATYPVMTPTAGYLFSDYFTNPTSGWDVRHDSNAITDYQNGEFVIFVGKIETILWSKPNLHLTNVIIEVDTREAAGPDDNLYGIICRYQDSNNFYRLVIAGNGYAGITKRAKGVVTVLSGPLLTRSPAVNRGQASNHLKAVCDGSQLSLFVNEQLIAQAQDSDFTGGDVGLLASTGKHPGVEIHFSHFTVKQP